MCEEDHEIEWLIDTTSSIHMAITLEYRCDFTVVTNGGQITFGNDSNGTIRGYNILTNDNFSIQRVSYVEGLKHNLICVGKSAKLVIVLNLMMNIATS